MTDNKRVNRTYCNENVYSLRTFMVVCLPREKLLLFSAYVNSCLLTARVEYFAIIGSRLIAECFAFIFQ